MSLVEDAARVFEGIASREAAIEKLLELAKLVPIVRDALRAIAGDDEVRARVEEVLSGSEARAAAARVRAEQP